MEKSILDNVELLQTSSVSKVGADDLWRLIQEAILKD